MNYWKILLKNPLSYSIHEYNQSKKFLYYFCRTIYCPLIILSKSLVVISLLLLDFIVTSKGRGRLWHLLKPKLQEFKSYYSNEIWNDSSWLDNVDFWRKVNETPATLFPCQKQFGDNGGSTTISLQFHIVLFKATAIPNFSAVTHFLVEFLWLLVMVSKSVTTASPL